jgi:hypothetical protein
MKKIVLLFLFLSIILVGFSQGIYKAENGEIIFFSSTPLEDIDAVNKEVKALLNSKNGELAFVVANIGFRFKKPLMEEHFNENYIESDQYKTSVFKGKIIDNIDYSKDRVYKVVTKGILNIHGVEREREIEGELIIKEGKITIKSEFNIKLADHKIKIPKVVSKNIAEVVKVSVNINFELKK